MSAVTLLVDFGAIGLLAGLLVINMVFLVKRPRPWSALAVLVLCVSLSMWVGLTIRDFS